MALQSNELSSSSQWLDALPDKNWDETMSNEMYRTVLKFRYLIPIHDDSLCQNCGNEGDIWGYHFIKCRGPQNCTHVVTHLIDFFGVSGKFSSRRTGFLLYVQSQYTVRSCIFLISLDQAVHIDLWKPRKCVKQNTLSQSSASHSPHWKLTFYRSPWWRKSVIS